MIFCTCGKAPSGILGDKCFACWKESDRIKDSVEKVRERKRHLGCSKPTKPSLRDYPPSHITADEIEDETE